MKNMYPSKLIFMFLSILCITGNVYGNCLLINQTLDQRVNNNSHIIEGQIIDQISFWSNDNSNILTANRIFVYKSFKGNVSQDEIVLITEGGTIGDKMQLVQPTLNSNIGEVGLFFLKKANNRFVYSESDIDSANQFVSAEESLGFIKYNLRENTAFDSHNMYEKINENFYDKITSISNNSYTELNTFEFVNNKETDQINYKGTTSNPEVYCFFPQYASSGSETMISLDGTDLGTFVGNASISLKSASSNVGQYFMIPAENIVSWTNENIQFIIPEKVGTCKIRITTSDNNTIDTDEDLFITFARSKTQGILTYLVDCNDQGGYTFKASTSIANGGVNFSTSDAFDAFERAISVVRENGLNFNIGGTTPININEDDDVNVVMFDNDANPLSSALGKMYRQFSNCGGEWEMVGVDVRFKRASSGPDVINWNYTESNPQNGQLDFQSIATHELLHGAQLKHSLNPDDVLYYVFSTGEQRRNPIACTDVSGLKYVIEQSQAITPMCGLQQRYEYPPEFIGYNNLGMNACAHSEECDPSTYDVGNDSITINVVILFEGLLNDDGKMNNGLAENELVPDEQPFFTAPFYFNSQSRMNEYPSGLIDWVLIELRDRFDPTNIITQKAVLVNEDGQLMDVDGTIGVKFHPSYEGDYFIAVRHKTHLDILSADYITLTNGTSYDFTDSMDKAMGNQQLQEKYGKYTMFTGDFDCNGIINVNDYNKWRVNSALINQYVGWDADGNGVINVVDYNLWKKNSSKIGNSFIVN